MKLKIVVIIITMIILFMPLIVFMKVVARQQTTIALDDVSPIIDCEQELLDKSDIYFVIPFYKDTKLTDYPEWCEEMRKSGKEMALHGLYHNTLEMGTDIDEAKLVEAISDFEECFGEKPTKFRPPMWKINDYNKGLISKYNMELMNNPLETSTYHCDERGFIFSILAFGD